jgi:hypothetical protein
MNPLQATYFGFHAERRPVVPILERIKNVICDLDSKVPKTFATPQKNRNRQIQSEKVWTPQNAPSLRFSFRPNLPYPRYHRFSSPIRRTPSISISPSPRYSR